MADLAAIDDAIAALEAQRALLGDGVVDTALQPLLAHRAELAARAVAEQRKLVTVLFSDLVDFTVLSQRLDPEDVRTVVDAYFVRSHQLIEANGGVVEKFIGDAVMAVFGLHRAEEEDPHRAIRTALAMQFSLDDINAQVAAAHNVKLEMRVGIDTGEVVVSTLGDRPGQEFVVMGDIVNRAARLQGAAPRGGVLISADTYRHVRGSFDVQQMPGLQLKGIAQPVDGYLVKSERARGFRLDDARGIEGVETSTVGREIELRRLQDRFYEVAEEHQWQMVTVVGDAGVGKSRLLSDFGRWLDDLPEPVSWFGGRAAHSGSRLPYALLHDLFATRFDIHDSDGPSEVRRKWERGVEQALGTGPDAVDKAHLIGQWLGFEIGESRSLDGVGDDPLSLSGRATAALAEYFRRLADQAPVVLLLEDLHWADEATLALINAADAVLRECQVLVVATTRPTLLERHPHWGEGLDFHTRLSLRSLSRRETRRLLDEILKRADHVPRELSDLVVMASEGNPFYVEELVNWFLEAEVITRDGDVWHVVEERLDQAQVPATLRSVLQARLDALTTAERVTLQRASVIGRVFWDDAVESLRSRQRPRARRARHARQRGARPPAPAGGRLPPGEVGVRPQPRVPVQARPAARRGLRGHAPAAPPDLPPAGRRLVRADGRVLRPGGRVRRGDRRAPRQRRRSRGGLSLVPDRRAAGDLRPCSRRRPPAARRGHRAGSRGGQGAALRPAPRPRGRARPGRRPGCAGDRSRHPRRPRSRGRRDRPGALRPPAADPLPMGFPPQQVPGTAGFGQTGHRDRQVVGPRATSSRRPACGWARA